MSKTDSGGWISKGFKVKRVCPSCTNDDQTLIETQIFGRVSRRFFCVVCSKLWVERDYDDDDR